MGRPRAFDHDECRTLYATGEWTQPQLAERYGVTTNAVRYALHQHVRDYQRDYQPSLRTPCLDCGTPSYGDRCADCANVARCVTVRDGALQCHTCHQWKPDSAFPRDRGKAGQNRRGKHGTCTACHTDIKRRYREAHREDIRAYDRAYKRRVRTVAQPLAVVVPSGPLQCARCDEQLARRTDDGLCGFCRQGIAA